MLFLILLTIFSLYRRGQEVMRHSHFSSIGGCGTARKGAHRYVPIGGKASGCHFGRSGKDKRYFSSLFAVGTLFSFRLILYLFFEGNCICFLSYFRREVLSRYCGIARWTENWENSRENVSNFNVVAEFPLYRRMWSGATVPLRYGPIEEKINDAAFSAWHWYEKLLFWKQGKWCVPRGMETSFKGILEKG